MRIKRSRRGAGGEQAGTGPARPLKNRFSSRRGQSLVDVVQYARERQNRMSANENQIVVYQPNETVRLDVRLENETVWLTQEQMVLLFGRDQSVIARHISNIFKEGELDRDSVYAKNAYTASDGKTYQVAYYNLDVVISVGCRVKSVQGTHFRQ